MSELSSHVQQLSGSSARSAKCGWVLSCWQRKACLGTRSYLRVSAAF